MIAGDTRCSVPSSIWKGKLSPLSRYESVLGSLSFSPASLRFEASFPGQAGSLSMTFRT